MEFKSLLLLLSLWVGWKTKEFWSELFHASEQQGGLLGEAAVQVIIWDHHHLHSSCQTRLYSIWSVFKNQTL